MHNWLMRKSTQKWTDSCLYEGKFLIGLTY